MQIVKRLLLKVKDAQPDTYLSLLKYLNTAIDNLASPAQLLMSRHL